MSFWDSFLGKTQKNDLAKAKSQADATLAQGKAEADAALGRGREDLLRYSDLAREDVTGGRDNALATLFSGRDAARGDITRGYDEAADTSREYLDRSTAYFQPYLDSGTAAQKLVADLQGLNGPQAQQAALATYQANPGLQAQVDRALLAVDRQARARGVADSGRTTLAAQRVASEMEAADFDKWRAGVTDTATRGGEYATRVANLTSSTGNALADLLARKGESLGNLEFGTGRAGADIHTGASNALAGISMGTGTGLQKGGKDQADLSYGYGATRAGNEISYGNALAASRNTGINNLLKVAELGVNAFGAYSGANALKALRPSYDPKWRDTKVYGS